MPTEHMCNKTHGHMGAICRNKRHPCVWFLPVTVGPALGSVQLSSARDRKAVGVRKAQSTSKQLQTGTDSKMGRGDKRGRGNTWRETREEEYLLITQREREEEGRTPQPEVIIIFLASCFMSCYICAHKKGEKGKK